MSDIADKAASPETGKDTAASTGHAVAFRGGGFTPRSQPWIGFVVFVVLILLAEWGTRSGWISALTLPRPSDVLQTFRELYESGLLFKHLGPSLSRLCVGAAIGVSIGISVGVLIGLFSYIRSGLVPVVAAIFPIPKEATLGFWPLHSNKSMLVNLRFLLAIRSVNYSQK